MKNVGSEEEDEPVISNSKSFNSGPTQNLTVDDIDDLRESAYEILLAATGASWYLFFLIWDSYFHQRRRKKKKKSRFKSKQVTNQSQQSTGLTGLLETMRVQMEAHQYVFQQLAVDLIGITSIKEVLVRLVGGDDHMYPNYAEVMQWLADSNLLKMIVDKLNPSAPPEVHANVAETLCAITRTASSPLASKLSSSSYVTRIFGHALEDSHSKSGLVHSLSVCISLLDPKKSAPSSLFNSFRSQHMYESPVQVHQETVGAMLPKLGEFHRSLVHVMGIYYFFLIMLHIMLDISWRYNVYNPVTKCSRISFIKDLIEQIPLKFRKCGYKR
uniref:Uncharacterized protein n=1 Tax=Lactuca sativa TaxID=4236 RepID=A0A9R1VIA4_LACSA|nr:hypothetical protein LSAT_V11C500280560 [Lactuca sativa]